MFVKLKLTTVIALLEANLVNCLSIVTISWSSDGPYSPNASSYPSLSFDESPSSFLLFLSMPAMSSDGVHIPNASSYPSFSFDESPSSFLLVLSFFAIKESYHRSNIIINPINLFKVYNKYFTAYKYSRVPIIQTLGPDSVRITRNTRYNNNKYVESLI